MTAISTLPAPSSGLEAVVVVPAHCEERRIGACLRALAMQRGIETNAYEVIVVLDRCRDATAERARDMSAEHPHLRLHLQESLQPGAGPARRLGMEIACDRLLAAGRPRGLIASTDADSEVAPDWLAVQIALVGAGARAIGGRVRLDRAEARLLAPEVLESRRVQAQSRLARVHSGAAGPRPLPAEHHQFSGASLAVTAEAYRAVGGLPCVEALEDEALERLLHERGIAIARSAAVQVKTSARTTGRASRGLSRDLALADWRARRTFRGASFDVRELARSRRATVSVILPARCVADTIGPIVTAIGRLRRDGLVDEILVVDAASPDGTAAVAESHGATVVQEAQLLPEYGPPRGKGDAMWRALSAARGDVVAFVDADTDGFDEQFVVGLLGPVLTVPGIEFVKGSFRRPFRVGGHVISGDGGRVTELVARPLLNLHMPQLAGFDQPLAGEVAARASLLRSLAFPVGYGVEIAMLIDVARTAGLDAMAQVDLGERLNRHQPLRDLSAMAYAVMVAAGTRLPGAGLAASTPPGPLALPPLPGEVAMDIRNVAVHERPALDAVAHVAPEPVPGGVPLEPEERSLRVRAPAG